MNKQAIFSVIKTLLSAVGAFLVGKNIFGTHVDASVLEIIVGAVMAVVSTAWSIVDKTAGIEQIQATIRQFVTMIGGFLISAGVIKATDLEKWLGLLLPVAALVYSWLSKMKNQEIESGKLEISDGKVIKQ